MSIDISDNEVFPHINFLKNDDAEVGVKVKYDLQFPDGNIVSKEENLIFYIEMPKRNSYGILDSIGTVCKINRE